MSLAGSDGRRDANTEGMSMSFQVVDVSKALLSLSKVCDQGHGSCFCFNKVRRLYIAERRCESVDPVEAVGSCV